MDYLPGHKRDLDGSGGYESSKRVKTEHQGPSRVLHVRGLPQFTSESELVQLCQPYGVIKTLILNAKQQAFIQMESTDAAASIVQRYASAPPYLRSKQVFFQYSSRNEVKAPAIAPGSSAYSGSAVAADGLAPPNHVVLVSILDARVPVTIENIHQIFKPYGEVVKIVTFVKDTVFKALVQMASVDSAVQAKLNLEGKDMFQGCCHLRIGFSKLKDLQVKQNGPRMRDFSKPDYSSLSAPFAQPQYLFPPQAAASFGAFGGVGGFDYKSMMFGADPFMAVDQKGCILLVNNVSEKLTPDKLFVLFGVYGDVMRIKIMFNKRDTALIQFATPQQAQIAQQYLNHLPLYEKELLVSVSKHGEISMPRADSPEEAARLTKDFSQSPIHRFKGRNVKNINAPSQVLHASSLPEGCSEDQVRKLFAQFQGSLPAVQFLKNNRTMAYVRMDSLQNALEALMQLHNYKMGDRYIRVSFSPKTPEEINDSDGGVGQE
jgi:hypothetical protein